MNITPCVRPCPFSSTFVKVCNRHLYPYKMPPSICLSRLFGLRSTQQLGFLIKKNEIIILTPPSLPIRVDLKGVNRDSYSQDRIGGLKDVQGNKTPRIHP